MGKNKKILSLSLVFVFLMVFSLTSVFAVGNYDQGVHRVGSSYTTQNHHYYENYRTRSSFYDLSGCAHDTYKTSCSSGRDYVDTIHYTQYGTQESRKSFLGDYVKDYSVYVTNRGRTGRYFTVTFDFEDKNGYDFSESVTYYLRTGEKKKFVYRDIQYERNEILDWGYKIIPQR
ncbi:MAG: hypothetical protein NTZ83_06505 [Candidatus Pacearchaeota archaeon]|nr:hypothetical protein [Candidatus Pacearchaeota archaeon]